MISDATFGDVPIVYAAITVFIAGKFNDSECWGGLVVSSEDVLPLGHHDKIDLIFPGSQGNRIDMKTSFQRLVFEMSLGLDAVRNGNTNLQRFRRIDPNFLNERNCIDFVVNHLIYNGK